MKYPFIDKKVWEDFVNSRTTHDSWLRAKKERRIELEISIHIDFLVDDMINLNRKRLMENKNKEN